MEDNKTLMQSVKEWLSSTFMMKDLGEACYILRIRIYRNRPNRLLGLSQSTYIDKVLRRFSVENSKKGNLHMGQGIKLSKKDSPSTVAELERMKRITYASAIGSIMYAMTCMRSDVAHELSMTCKFQQNPREEHWKAVKSILKYLRRTKEYFLVYSGQEKLVCTGYTDASFQTDLDDFKSQSRYAFIFNGGRVSWKSSKQATTADSTTEAEYIARSEVG
ncbi:hypothetical protein RND71_026646 [Anisodus tanguticus]|uniref:Retrotransposon protein, putative, Ty1-copia subclass n=1 Tax=Anisodus tanguticus TaxID=243964 RepID=A0AAE1RP99_9SOLA|nr:hypothetical protein RND71_026646 [Anisodus tanguticus]